MAKLRLKKFALFVSISICLTGCGYRFLTGGTPKIYIPKVMNFSTRPLIDIYLEDELKKTFVEYPGFSTVNSEKRAGYILKVRINKWERKPLFFSWKENREIMMVRFDSETEVSLLKEGDILFNEVVTEFISVTLDNAYDEEDILRRACKELANKIYFLILEKNEKKF